jgi:hypothetical protein
MSKELGWYKILILNKVENVMQVAPKIKAYRFPFKVSIVFQTIKSVRAPKRAGKNFTQKTEFPSKRIR